MLLAEALLRRTDLKSRQAQLRKRIRVSLIVQEGDKPLEDPQELIARFEANEKQLSRLATAINHTNDTHKITTKRGVMTITQAMAQQRSMKRMATALRQIATDADPGMRYSLSEIRMIPQLDVGELESEADRLADDLTDLNVLLQKSDWGTSLVSHVSTTTTN